MDDRRRSEAFPRHPSRASATFICIPLVFCVVANHSLRAKTSGEWQRPTMRPWCNASRPPRALVAGRRRHGESRAHQADVLPQEVQLFGMRARGLAADDGSFDVVQSSEERCPAILGKIRRLPLDRHQFFIAPVNAARKAPVIQLREVMKSGDDDNYDRNEDDESAIQEACQPERQITVAKAAISGFVIARRPLLHERNVRPVHRDRLERAALGACAHGKHVGRSGRDQMHRQPYGADAQDEERTPDLAVIQVQLPRSAPRRRRATAPSVEYHARPGDSFAAGRCLTTDHFEASRSTSSTGRTERGFLALNTAVSIGLCKDFMALCRVAFMQASTCEP